MTQTEIMNAARREKAERGEVTEIETNLIKKALAHPTSKVMAIAAACCQCFGGSVEELPDAGWRDAIRGCTSPNCALYRHRPYR
jgi:hypothetical protein